MNSPAQPADRPEPPLAPRPDVLERIARVAADFDAGRHNPFESVDLSPLSPEVRAKVDAWQRERGFTPAA